MCPSDLLGNYYLSPIDRFLADASTPSARYVDDLNIFVQSVDTADRLLRDLVPMLRSYDLSLNEAKCKIIPSNALITEEPDLETLFENAIGEISTQLEVDDFHEDYGFQVDWEHEGETEPKKIDLELQATKMLFDSTDTFPGHEENIERFCLPLFSKALSDYAVEHVVQSFRRRPAMAQIYCAYLANFIDNQEIYSFICQWLTDPSLFDWQRMWVLAALHSGNQHTDSVVRNALDILKDAGRHEALRAVAGMFVGRFGDHTRRMALISAYSAVGSPYIQSAILFSSASFPAQERRNALKNWSGHSPLHKLIANVLNRTKS